MGTRQSSGKGGVKNEPSKKEVRSDKSQEKGSSGVKQTESSQRDNISDQKMPDTDSSVEIQTDRNESSSTDLKVCDKNNQL